MFIKFFYLLFLIDRDTSKSHIKRFVFSKLVAFWFSKSLLKRFSSKVGFPFEINLSIFSKTFCLSGVVDKRVTFWFSKSLKKNVCFVDFLVENKSFLSLWLSSICYKWAFLNRFRCCETFLCFDFLSADRLIDFDQLGVRIFRLTIPSKTKTLELFLKSVVTPKGSQL